MTDNEPIAGDLEHRDELTREIQRVCSQFEGPNQFADAMGEIDSLREQVVNLKSVIKTAVDFLKVNAKGNESAPTKQLLHTMRWTIAYLEGDFETMRELVKVDWRDVL